MDIKTDFNVLPNKLDEFDTSTYHFRLFMVDPLYFRKNEVGPINEQIVIAESGSTAIGIDEVTIMSTHGYDSSVEGSGTALKFEISLIQPFNANLFDLMYSASLSLGIPNFNKCPYYLELTFLGNDPQTSEPTIIGGHKWTWMLQFITVNTEIKSNGSTYDISAVALTDIAFSDQACVLQEASVVTDEAESVQAALDGLVSNLESKQRTKGSSMVYDEWVIQIVGDNPVEVSNLQNSKIVHDQQEGKSTRNNNLHFSDGTSLQKAIDEILASSEYFQNKAKSSKEKNENKDDKDDLHDRVFKTLPKIIPDVDILDYDPLRGDYARRYTYNITPYLISTVTSSPEEGRLDKGEMQERANAYSSTHRIRKHYNYLYTGKNQQVQNIDLKFKMSWFVSMPRREGTAYTSESAVGAKFKQDQIDRNAIFNQNVKNSGNRAVLSEDSKQRKIAIQENVTKLQSEKDVNAIKISESQDEKVIKSLTAANESLEAKINKSREELKGLAGGITGFNATTVDVALSQELAKGRSITDVIKETRPSNTPFNKYVEDFDVTDKSVFIDLNANKRLPITFVETNEDDMIVGPGALNVKSKDKVLYSAIFAQGNRSNGADLIRIELAIKGDPFWLGQSKFNNGKIIDSKTMILNEKSGSGIDPNMTKHYTQENYFLFTTQTPDSNVIFGSSGSMSSKTMINGIYGVITSKHNFKGGRFNTVLTAVIDYVTDLREIDVYNFLGVKQDEARPEIINAGEKALENTVNLGKGISSVLPNPNQIKILQEIKDNAVEKTLTGLQKDNSAILNDNGIYTKKDFLPPNNDIQQSPLLNFPRK